jgi:hypothetical protein
MPGTHPSYPPEYRQSKILTRANDRASAGGPHAP